MKKHYAIALVLALSAVLLTGCRRPMDDGMTDPATGTTTMPVETLMTEPTTMPTTPSTEATQPSHPTTEPGDTTGATDTTQDTQARARSHPRY